ncbi:MAG: hypothetical protein JSS40_04570 [Proteobacteria bacterium]|nr:hypothetical protein [Pseudomonadota bacterium]
MNPAFRIAALACLCAALSGCLGPTPYQVKAYNGGYEDKPVSGERHFVAFYGNGFTSREAVLKYWLYRCAEVTSKAGYDYFVLIARAAPRQGASVDGNALAAIDIEFLGTGEAIQAKGGGSSGSRAPVYVPGGGGGSVTRWSASGVIEMYKGFPLSQNAATFVAKELLDKLGPEIRAGVVPGQGYKIPEPNRDSASGEGDATAPGSPEPVKLDDLQDLLPK